MATEVHVQVLVKMHVYWYWYWYNTGTSTGLLLIELRWVNMRLLAASCFASGVGPPL